MFFNEDHLRVSRPVTTDGINPVLNEKTGAVLQKIVHLPKTAKKFMEIRNSKLPQHLKMKIEEIKTAQS